MIDNRARCSLYLFVGVYLMATMPKSGIFEVLGKVCYDLNYVLGLSNRKIASKVNIGPMALTV